MPVAGRVRTLEKGERGDERHPATTAMKAPEHGGLQKIDRIITITCSLSHSSMELNTLQENTNHVYTS